MAGHLERQHIGYGASRSTSMPTIALPAGTRARRRVKRALRLRSPRDTPLPLPVNVLLLRWDTKLDSA